MTSLAYRLATGAAVLALAATGCGPDTDDPVGAAPEAFGSASPPAPAPPTPSPAPSRTSAPAVPAAQLPQGGRKIFPAYRVVAYYGTAGNPVLGVLGESTPEGILPRLRAAAAGFAAPGRKVQLAYELIVTVAQAGPGTDGNYSQTIDLDKVKRYVDAARRHKILVVLDVQPGRTDFLTEVKKLQRFLEEPHVGLALDPEWRMPPGKVPGRTIGTVSAAEINAVSAYVADIVRRQNLPEKLFLLHQFRASMIPDIARVQRRPGLAMVQHLDGFGTRAEKNATFARLRRPQQFHIGYKLFYDEDINLYRPREVLAMKPAPEYISYQ
ncbi:MAG TPA: hypothetical protein VFR67_04965 [Pilimelia sp.]|nr:hypothetical protein [Pilimelia sp.]